MADSDGAAEAADVEEAAEAGEAERESLSCKPRTSDIGMATHLEAVDPTKPASICWLNWPDEPWAMNWYITVRGQESLHVYLWIMKDLSWVQAWYYPGHVFGIASIAFMMYIFMQAIRKRSLDECWTTVAHILWLVANYVWMTGELHDTEFPNEPSMYDQRALECGYIMMAALIWIGLYYVLLKPLHLMNERTAKGEEYNTTGLQCRFKWFFKSWREYENFHILLWIGKDLSWNLSIGAMWIIFFIPTIICSVDFLWVSLQAPNLLVDHAHYVALSIWVCANAVWAIANIWYADYDTAFGLFDMNNEALKTGRWFSSWVLILSWQPIIILHIFWIYGTYTGHIVEEEVSMQPRKTEATEMTQSPFSHAESAVKEAAAAAY